MQGTLVQRCSISPSEVRIERTSDRLTLLNSLVLATALRHVGERREVIIDGIFEESDEGT